jgi:uncharacterized small protein (TIGR04563 family)
MIGGNFGGGVSEGTSGGGLTANGKRRGRPPGSGKARGIGAGIGAGFGGSETTPDKRKASIYLPDNILEQVSAHAGRLDRSVSKMIQIAWRLALPQIEAMTGIDDNE